MLAYLVSHYGGHFSPAIHGVPAPTMHSSLILNSGDYLLSISKSVLAIRGGIEMGSELGFNNFPPKINQDTNFIKDGLL